MSAKFNSVLLIACTLATKAYASLDSLNNPFYSPSAVSHSQRPHQPFSIARGQIQQQRCQFKFELWRLWMQHDTGSLRPKLLLRHRLQVERYPGLGTFQNVRRWHVPAASDFRNARMFLGEYRANHQGPAGWALGLREELQERLLSQEDEHQPKAGRLSWDECCKELSTAHRIEVPRNQQHLHVPRTPRRRCNPPEQSPWLPAAGVHDRLPRLEDRQQPNIQKKQHNRVHKTKHFWTLFPGLLAQIHGEPAHLRVRSRQKAVHPRRV